MEKDWQPIETAPKDGTEILLWVPELETVDLASWVWSEKFDEGLWLASSPACEAHARYGRVPELYTQWRPLPDPPTLPQEKTNG